MANQYTKFTRENIERKMNRKKNPVRSIAQLAREFGYNTQYYRYGNRIRYGTAASGAFRKRLQAVAGGKIYNQLRDESSVNIAYR